MAENIQIPDFCCRPRVFDIEEVIIKANKILFICIPFSLKVKSYLIEGYWLRRIVFRRCVEVNQRRVNKLTEGEEMGAETIRLSLSAFGRDGTKQF